MVLKAEDCWKHMKIPGGICVHLVTVLCGEMYSGPVVFSSLKPQMSSV